MARTHLFSSLQRLVRLRQQQIDRRAVLVAGASGVLGLLGQLTLGCDGPALVVKRPDTGQHRVAIVGAGLAGLHCAYRLKQVGVLATVYEASSRSGGRTFTDRKNFSDQVAELGGEFIDTGHVTLQALATEFGIVLDDREADLGASTRKDVWWVDGAEVAESTLLAQFKHVAPLMAELMTQADSDDAVFAELDRTSLSEWLVQNVPPRAYPELHAVLSSAYRGEYGLEVEQQSVLNLLYLIGSDPPEPFRIFGDSDERFHAHSGSQTFCDKLFEAVSEQVTLNMRLVRVHRSGETTYTLRFEQNNAFSEVEVEHVVFALPFSTLRDVDLKDLQLPADKLKMIKDLGYGTNAKVMGAFRERVWKTMHDASGSTTTDGPLQQTWDSAVGQSGSQGILTNFLGGQQGVEAGRGEAEDWYRQIVLEGIEPLFPGAKDAYVLGSAVRMHWPTHPFTKGSYACYRPGQWSFWSHEGERVDNVHFCGEHTSIDFQGYMEGAAETGSRAAGEILDQLKITPTAIHQGLLGLWRDLPSCGPSGRPCFVSRRRELSGRIEHLLLGAGANPRALT